MGLSPLIRSFVSRFLLCATLVFCLGCTKQPSHDHGTEIISTIELTFAPTNGQAPIVASFTDPDGDGGVSGTSEPIQLPLGLTYAFEIRLLNELVEPPVDITQEIGEESEGHMVLVYGDGVVGPASSSMNALVVHEYADLESDYGHNLVGEDLPVGLRNTIAADRPGISTLSVMLRHLPELNGTAQKSSDIPERFAQGQAIAGDVDVDVEFELTVE